MNIEIITLNGLLDNTDHFDWSELSSENPFSTLNFYKTLESSKSIGKNTGWTPLYFVAIERNVFSHNDHTLSHPSKLKKRKPKQTKVVGILYTFLKHHSYGEYIFDWDWANFFEQNAWNYYPKLTTTTPFTPVNAPKSLYIDIDILKKLIEAKDNYLTQNKEITGAHFLFVKEELFGKILSQEDYLKRYSLQYHFHNKFESFENFLASLKARKRKQIKKERLSTNELNLDIKKYEFSFPKNLGENLYQLYLTTIKKKNSYAYLTRDFFNTLITNCAKDLLIFCAYKKDSDSPSAMSLFFKSKTTLYGRYWGCLENYEQSSLHFEMCYYLGMDYCFENKIEFFEAGAQGEQKLLRGFRPVFIKSYHKMGHPKIHALIDQYIEAEKKMLIQRQTELKSYLPYKQTD